MARTTPPKSVSKARMSRRQPPNARPGLDHMAGIVSPARQRSSELAHCLLMLLIFDLGKVARDLKEHPLTGRNLPRPFLANALVKSK